MALIATILVCTSLSAVDGDTLRCDNQRLRLLGEGIPYVVGIDTPEMGDHARCDKERDMAARARDRLTQLISKGVTIEAYGVTDRYRRPLVNVYDNDGNEVGKLLLKEGLARQWHPRHKNDWCD